MMKKLLSISTDRKMFVEGSAVRERMLGYARDWDEMHIIVASDTSFQETFIGTNIWIYPTRSRVKIRYPFDAIKLGRFIIRGRQITNITCQDPFLTGMAAMALKKETGLPLEIQVHTDIGSPNYARTFADKIRKAMALSYLPKADSIRVVSNRIKDYLVGHLNIPETKISVRPIAVNTEAIKNAPITVDLHQKYPQFKKIVLMASRLTEEKNIEMAIRAFAQVLKSIPDAGLVIVGSGPREPALRGLIKDLHLENAVFVEGWADPAVLFSYYKSADIYLLTSLFEGYGMTLVEAQAAGTRIVSTDVGVAGEVGATIVDWSADDIARGITSALAL